MRVMNSPRAIERTVDKFWTSALLEQCGLPRQRPSSANGPRRPSPAFRGLGDVIVKPLFGSMGLGMVRVSDEEMAFRVFQTIEQIRGVYYLQRTIDHEGRDIRAFVVGGRVWRPSSVGPPAGAPTSPGARPRGRSSSRKMRARSPCGRRPRSAPSTPAWTCCRRATARPTCSRSTGSPAGRDCSRPRDSTWPEP